MGADGNSCGHTALQESMSVVGVPVMTKASFIHTERDVGEWWSEQLRGGREGREKNRRRKR